MALGKWLTQDYTVSYKAGNRIYFLNSQVKILSPKSHSP